MTKVDKVPELEVGFFPPFFFFFFFFPPFFFIVFCYVLLLLLQSCWIRANSVCVSGMEGGGAWVTSNAMPGIG